MEDCLSGVITRKQPSHWTLTLDGVSNNYLDFYTKYKTIFQCMINFPEIEVSNSRTTSPNTVVEKILSHFDKYDNIISR